MSRRAEHAGFELSFELPDLKQRDADAFFRHLRSLAPEWRTMGVLERASAFAKAAIRMGWYPGWTVEQIDECSTPGLVSWLGMEADAHLASYVTIPPNSKRPLPTTSEATV